MWNRQVIRGWFYLQCFTDNNFGRDFDNWPLNALEGKVNVLMRALWWLIMQKDN